MKKFLKMIHNCKECPNMIYTHFDGEGTCAPYQYYHPNCKAISETHRDRYTTQDHRGIREVVGREYTRYRPLSIRIVERGTASRKTEIAVDIPDWCPLEDV